MIETIRLLLRRPTPEDMYTLENLWRNEKVRKFLGGIVAEEILSEKITALKNHWDTYQFGFWVVCEKKSHQITGICGLQYSEDGVELSYMFFPQYWGKGYAQEAAIASMDYGFNTLKLEIIIAITQAANTKSCQLLEKIGMIHINNFERFNAIQCLYELKLSEWRSV